MAREIGYYWVRHKNSQAEWAVGNWDGLLFFLSSNGPIHANFLEIDERRIVRAQAEEPYCPACEQFVEHLEQATEIVRSWPIWKQTVLGGNEAAIGENRLEIDEGRIVRDETKQGVRKSEKAKRNLHITAVVLGGDRMTDVANLHGLTSHRVRQIVHRTLERRNPALFKSLASFRPGQITPSIGDLATHAAEFGFRLQAEVGDGQKQ